MIFLLFIFFQHGTVNDYCKTSENSGRVDS